MIHHSLRMLALFLVALGSTTLTTEAFVPSAAKPRTTPLTLPPSGTFGGAPLVVSCAAGGGSTTALAMGQGHLMDRFFRVARSNLHTAVSSLEHPETIIGQAVRDMQVGATRRPVVRTIDLPFFFTFVCLLSHTHTITTTTTTRAT
jgi:hypothetical protein